LHDREFLFPSNHIFLFKQEKDDGLTLTYLNKENELPLSVTHEVTYAAGIET
jgi:hypothetical protein